MPSHRVGPAPCFDLPLTDPDGQSYTGRGPEISLIRLRDPRAAPGAFPRRVITNLSVRKFEVRYVEICLIVVTLGHFTKYVIGELVKLFR